MSKDKPTCFICKLPIDVQSEHFDVIGPEGTWVKVHGHTGVRKNCQYSLRWGVGMRVVTMKDAGGKDWVDRTGCRWGVVGTIVNQHDSHGLCYDVEHDGGGQACYDPEELEPSKEG